MRSFIILVVDDDRAARQEAVAALEGDGFRVLEARSGGEAMALLERHPGIDLVFTEIVMPGIGGFMLADMARVRRPDLKVLYTSRFEEIAALKVERLVGTLVAKPHDAAALRDAVHHALRAAMPAQRPPATPRLPPSTRPGRSPLLGL
jgi:CheY-like chemotaxis protein